MKQSENSINCHFRIGNVCAKAIPCEVFKGLKPGIYPSFNAAAKANRTYASYLKAIADGKFKSKVFEVIIIE